MFSLLFSSAVEAPITEMTETHYLYDQDENDHGPSTTIDAAAKHIPTHVTFPQVIKPDESSDWTSATASTAEESSFNNSIISFGYYRDYGVMEVEHTLAEYHGMLYLEEFRERVEEGEEEDEQFDDDHDDEEDDDSILSLNWHEKDEFEEFVQSNQLDFSCFAVLGLDLEGEDLQYKYTEDIRLIRSEDEGSLQVEPTEAAGLKFSSREYRHTEVRGPSSNDTAIQYASVELVHLEKCNNEDVVVPEKQSLSFASSWDLRTEEGEYQDEDDESSTIGPMPVNLEPVGIKLSSGSDRFEVQGYTTDSVQGTCREHEPVELVHLEPRPTTYDDELGIVGEVGEETKEVLEAYDDVYGEEYVAEEDAKEDDEF
jgi:hypothetical protein